MDSLPCRKTIRLQNYDYSQNGAYFVTICTAQRQPLFGKIISLPSNAVGAGPRPARVELSPYGEIVAQTWDDLPNHNSGLSLGPFIIMPDHIHGILILEGRAGLGPAPTAIPELVRQLKSFSARKINKISNEPKRAIWQRGYYEHVLRSQQDFDGAAQYIRGNPARWAEGSGRVLCGCPPDPLVFNPN